MEQALLVAPRRVRTRCRRRSPRCTPRRAPRDTDWSEIVGLYDVLARMTPSPVVELNRAVAVAMRDGPEAGLALIDAILAAAALADYHLAHAARPTCAGGWAGWTTRATSYERALALARQEPERRFLGGAWPAWTGRLIRLSAKGAA